MFKRLLGRYFKKMETEKRVNFTLTKRFKNEIKRNQKTLKG